MAALSLRRLSLQTPLQFPEIEITDSKVAAYLPRVKKSGLAGRIKLNLNTDPKDIPELEELLGLLTEQNCELCQLTFKHDFRYPSASCTPLDPALTKALQSCPIRKFWGQLSGEALAAVPETVVDLYISIGSEKHYVQVSSELSSIMEKLPRLDDLQIHLAAHVDVSLLKPLPGSDILYLYLSNVSDQNLDWAVRAAAAMQPISGSQRFSALRFPLCNFTEESFKTFLEGLKREDVQFSSLWISSKNIPRLHHDTFRELTLDILGQDLILLNEIDIWRF
ncbi:uncharacterized protein [Palaemon carinicauda]|uniref:uncharacterized protein n=1 Tax=Palaemon carinicauda TaxID=392227 RepID=UPI0035B5ABC8